MVRFGPEICQDLDAALAREWLETNGLGGYASGTIAGAHTRRYHGLLVAALKPPVDRMVLLSKVDETVTTAAGSAELGCNLFPGAVHPAGYQLLEEFRLDPGPIWRWQVGGGSIEKSVHLLDAENTVLIEYRFTGPDPVTVEVRPFLAFRDYHATTHANGALNSQIREEPGSASIQPYGDLPELRFSYDDATLTRTGHWYYRFLYPRERERGLDFEEDLFQPFALRFELGSGKPVQIFASLEQNFSSALPRLTADPADLSQILSRASQQFFAARGKETTVMAGYHWFTDWGRDTMIALPGLALATGHVDIAKQVLLAFVPWMYQGLLPNRFPDAGEAPEYNSTDATLWFVDAVRAYVEASGDFDVVRETVWPALRDVVDWRDRGTLHGIRVAEDGLLTGGAPGVQLTWMDAKVGDHVITPRTGKPVEIQALWYNALRIIAEFATRLGENEFATKCGAMADQARESFEKQFWNDRARCLFDVIDGDAKDPSIRPNQVIVWSLGHQMLDLPKGAQVLEVVERELLTPFGLRTLSPGDPNYRARYEGDQASRDGAYHQGTVWPWLLGPYARALLTIQGRTEATLSQIREMLYPFREHILEAGLGQVSEIFDGDPPHAPKGCIAQAWSVGELLAIERLIES